MYQNALMLYRSYSAVGANLPELTYFRRSKRTRGTPYWADEAKIADGFLVITRFDLQKPGYVMDLMVADGSVIHQWHVDHSGIFSGGNPLEFVHGSRVLPDGSALVNFDEGIGVARIDVCGQAIWTREDGTYHHEIEVEGDGFWTWFAPGRTTPHGNILRRMDLETGTPTQDIHLVKDVIQTSDSAALLMTIPAGFKFDFEATADEGPDTFHPNDIAPLPADLAPAFPMFEAGDLLISLRDIHMIGVIDRETNELLWSRQGPWLSQHDPDWQADGTISVYSNNMDRFRSNLISIDPASGEVRETLPRGSLEFDSFIMGTHQLLPNGNWLILSSMEGRVLEVTPEGEIVREVSNMLNARYNGLVPNVEFLPPGYFDTLPSCG